MRESRRGNRFVSTSNDITLSFTRIRAAVASGMRMFSEAAPASTSRRDAPCAGMLTFVQLAPVFRARRVASTSVKSMFMKLRSEEHTSELQSQFHLVCRLLLEKKNTDL